ncbi:hypothetical protein HWQ56_00660 [Pseudomonas eucalypticola]|uniref:Uncharacterized protein n=1 Tax=Pseudomonas eucalypticola TaxID=2599595 RepID=A0A7D5D415_9PSED|nr:hypothetical protein HWQ56_00660 [Pseudomonas eucalypticola]
MFLPNRHNMDNSVPGILHNGRHPNSYVVAVNDIIIAADGTGGQAVLRSLGGIREQLLSSGRNAKWSDLFT